MNSQTPIAGTVISQTSPKPPPLPEAVLISYGCSEEPPESRRWRCNVCGTMDFIADRAAYWTEQGYHTAIISLTPAPPAEVKVRELTDAKVCEIIRAIYPHRVADSNDEIIGWNPDDVRLVRAGFAAAGGKVHE